MPRQGHRFDLSQGFITVRSKNVSGMAPEFAKNLENDDSPGQLRGRLGDLALDVAPYLQQGVLLPQNLQEGGIYDLLYLDKKREVKFIEDFYGANSDTKVGVARGLRPILINMGNEARIAEGKISPPQFVGRITHKGFGNTTTSGIVVESIEVKSPTYLPQFDDALIMNGGLFCFQNGDDQLYRIDLSTKAVTKTEIGMFTKIRAITLAYSGTELWVADEAPGFPYGRLVRLGEDLVEDFSVTLDAPALNGTSYPFSPILMRGLCATANKLWIAYVTENPPGGPNIGGDYLLNHITNCTTPTSTQTLYKHDIRDVHTNSYGQGGLGEWMAVSPSGREQGDGNRLAFHKLVALDTTGIGVVVIGEKLRHFNLGGYEYWAPKFWSMGHVLKDIFTPFIYTVAETQPPYATSGIIQLPVPFLGFDGSYDVEFVGGFVNQGTTCTGALAISLEGNIQTLYTFSFLKSNIPWLSGAYLEASVSSPVLGTGVVPCAANTTKMYSMYGQRAIEGKRGIEERNWTTLTSPTTWLSTQQITTTLVETDNGQLDAGTYFYRFALVFNETEQTPLSALNTSLGVGKLVIGNNKCITVTLTIHDFTEMPALISAIQIYRGYSQLGTVPDEYMRLLRTIPFGTGWVHDEFEPFQVTYSFVDDETFLGASYEAQTGIPETMEDVRLFYELGCLHMNNMYVAKCKQPLTEEVYQNYVFKSKAGQWDVFDWSSDFVILPTVPVAMIGFGSYLYAFDEHRMYQIDPERMVVEQEYPGIGVFGPFSVLNYQGALYIAGKTGLYRFDERSLTNLSDPIKSGEAFTTTPAIKTWADVQSDVMLFVDELKHSLYILCELGNGYPELLVYHLRKNRWDYWDFGLSGLEEEIPEGWVGYGGFTGRQGEVYLQVKDTLRKMCFDTTRRSWIWITGPMDFGNAALIKKVYRTKMECEEGAYGAISQAYARNRATTWTLFFGLIPYADWMVNTVSLKLEGYGAQSVNDFSVLYRLMVGVR